MLKLDEFVVKENDKFFIDFQEYKNKDGISYEDGDMIKFTFDNIKYIGTLFKMNNDESFFEIKKIKELGKL